MNLGDTRLALLEEHATDDLGFGSSNSTLGVEMTKNKYINFKK